MPNQSVTISPSLVKKVFQGTPGITVPTYLPRGQLVFSTVGGAIAAKTLGNTETVLATCTLPANNAYQLCSANVAVDCVDAAHSDQFADAQFIRVDPGDGTRTMIALSSAGASLTPTAGTGDTKVWVNQPYGGLIYNLSGAEPEVTVRMGDADTGNAANARRLFLDLCFYIFDIDQVTSVAVNAPMPVRIT